MGYAAGALIAGGVADALGYGGAIAIVAALTAASGLWVLVDMPARARERATPSSTTVATAGLKKAFDGSFIDSFPGLDTAWLLLGLLDAIAFLLFAASLLIGEFLPERRKTLLLGGLGVSIFTFAVMMFANNMIASYETVASLFSYFTGTVIVIGLVLLMPPYRGRKWLSRITDS